MKIDEARKIRVKALELLMKAHVVVTPDEAENMEVADFGLGDIGNIGLQVVVCENNRRYCAKEIILLPRQICPEHRHPPVDSANPGKQETFRCRWGVVYLYTSGEPAARPRAIIPGKYRPYFTVWNEIILRPGDQFTLPPDTLHWFQSGDEGAVLSEFSSSSIDELDIWTQPGLDRMPRYDV